LGRGQRAESGELRVESGERRAESQKVYFSTFYEGLTPPSLFLCRPKGLSGCGKRIKTIVACILRGAYATIAIFVSP